MRAYDVIDKKKKGFALGDDEITEIIDGYVKGEIPDYQISALLMAIYFNGMNDRELLTLTKCMAQSGDQIDLSAIDGIKVDKHSTGGVGDKTTLVVAPVVAACGGKVAKMSGRGLGFTGGTIDKLESIPGFNTTIPQRQFFDLVNEIGCSVIGQSTEVAPADKKLYALRDVTATVDSIPLIASSIMSKKIASGSNKIVLDVTVGSGAFMKNREDALCLAEKMVQIGEGAGRETIALLTNMDVPLGCRVGNNLEVKEAIETLQGNGPEDFTEICVAFSSYMLYLANIAELQECKRMVESVIKNGTALTKLGEMVERQNGDSSYIYHPEKFKNAAHKKELTAKKDGYIWSMNTEMCGETSVILGAGRETKDSPLDMTAGIEFMKKTGDFVKSGEVLAVLYANEGDKLAKGVSFLENAYVFSEKKPETQKEIIALVTKDGVTRY